MTMTSVMETLSLTETDNEFVLCSGHVVVKDENVEVEKKDGTIYIRSSAPIVIKHKEHGELTLRPGNYNAGGVMEKDHFTDEERLVKD